MPVTVFLPKTMKAKTETVDVSQTALIEKFTTYLKQRDLDTKGITGYCFGLSMLWAYQKRLGQEQDFFDLVTKIASWNEKDDLEVEFEKLFSKIEWLHSASKIVPYLSQGRINETIQIADFPIQNEFLNTFVYKENEIIELLEKVLSNQNKPFIISSHNHAVGVINENGIFKLYNTNSKKGICEFKSVKELVTHKDKGLLQAYVFENSRLGTLKAFIKGKSWPKYIPLSVRAFDLANEPVGTYPQNFTQKILADNPERKDDVNRSSWDDVTAAWMAARDNDIERLNILKEMKADFNKTDVHGQTPLFAAVHFHSTEAIRWLLDNGADINIIYKSGRNIMKIALAGGCNLEIILSLFFAAITQGNDDMIIPLIDNGILTDMQLTPFNGSTPLHHAIKYKRIEVVKDLIGLNPKLVTVQDDQGKMLLDIAREQHDDDLIDFILKVTLQESIVQGNTDQVKKLIRESPEIINKVSLKHFTPLQLAVKTNNMELAQFLIENGADINVIVDHCSLLHFAAELGNTDMIDFLIKEGIKRSDTWDQDSPLMMAVRYGHLEAVNQFIKYKESVDFKDDRGNTLLHIAISNNSLHIVKELLENSIIQSQLETTNKSGLTALQTAVVQGRTEAVALLLAHGANDTLKTKEGNTLLHLAAYLNDNTILKMLIDRNANAEVINNEGLKPIHHAIEGNSLENVKYLLKINPQYLEKEALFILKTAVESNNLDILKYLMEEEHIIDHIVDTTSIKLFHWIANDTQHIFPSKNEMINYLIDKNFDINERDEHGMTMLHIAVKNNDLDYVKFVMGKGGDISIVNNNKETPKDLAKVGTDMQKFLDYIQFCLDIKNKNITALKKNSNKNVYANEKGLNGDTPLHVAIKSGSPAAIVNFLLKDCHCDINLKNNDGDTALHLAAKTSSANIVQTLLNVKDVNVYVRDKKGKTVLHNAVLSEKIDIVDMLLHKDNTFVYLKDENNQTPLHYAAQTNNLIIINQLLNAGANINRADNKGQTPLHIAIELGNVKVIEFLIKKGASFEAKDSTGLSPIDKANAKGKEIFSLLSEWEEKRKQAAPQIESLLGNILSYIKNIEGLKFPATEIANNLMKTLKDIPKDMELEEYKFRLNETIKSAQKLSKGTGMSFTLFSSTSHDLEKMFVVCKKLIDESNAPSPTHSY